MTIKQFLFNNLPIELENYIMELNGSMLHFERMKKMKKDLQLKGICNYLHNLPSFEWFDIITDAESKIYMDLLSDCSCCKEHQKKRPTTIMMIEGCLPPYSESGFHKNRKCKCRCRNLARNMCRERNDVEELN